jgi:uncharacterized protein (TIGR03000 family)
MKTIHYGTALLLVAIWASTILAQSSFQAGYRYPYDYGFHYGQYPYYTSPFFVRTYDVGVPADFPFANYRRFYEPKAADQGRTPSSAATPSLSPEKSPTRTTWTLRDRAILDVILPSAEAALWVQGRENTRPGSVRSFLSPILVPGQSFEFNVKATWKEGKQDLQVTQTAIVRVGERSTLHILNGEPARK